MYHKQIEFSLLFTQTLISEHKQAPNVLYIWEKTSLALVEAHTRMNLIGSRTSS